jgi:hypothetical protein
MSVLYFDTSAINRLADDPNRSLLLKALRREVCSISIFTVIELASTPDNRRRLHLITTAKQLVGDSRPLAMPGDILRRVTQAFSGREQTMDASMGSEWDGLWLALSEPTFTDADMVAEAQEWKTSEENWYQDILEKARPIVQSELQKRPKDEQDWITKYPSRLLKHFCRNREFMVDVVNRLSPPAVLITNELAEGVIENLDPWRFFLAGLAFGFYRRSLQPSGYGRQLSPGSIDTQQSIYLAGCDRFVTADQGGEGGPWGGQLAMMRTIIPYGTSYKRTAWHFNQLRDWCTIVGSNR